MDEQHIELVLTREFNTARAIVWRAWTECEHLKNWWGPNGFAMSYCKLELRPGGLFHHGITAPDGRQMWRKFVFREIDTATRLVFVTSFSDANGGTLRHPMNAHWPLEILTTLTFSELERGTMLEMRQTPVNASAAEREAFGAALEETRHHVNATLDRLDAYLASSRSDFMKNVVLLTTIFSPCIL